ncbi:LysM peptidoglycan-binding domain-containing protein [Clostridium botulinum]|uniref:Spore gernimation protein n=1 Tax=Clostridium botulinum C/D str. DC5 TaxID=1443128 RepID=A0A0A0IG69_CLOBO|nr:LysM peptidoglycan-binding domain-containing protein [Clostridium botulinum]KEI03229.1 spore gernimation protein [Clostridium botulinum C/D str. BKT75002]KEI07605.1 spore gernimation protein [Clostridium botulinum C/D str. BKT2873]KGM95662.1 spore gernimation protein [Clostridium botulinum D str. CCUG 7971]KGM99987.1 spore gernimation protein [Clostridium botulinum C/D str. DC5]KOC47727.1 spore gernimation protein [Clostridium botulinum]
MVIYVVKPGDTIYSIGQRYGISANKIIKDNEVKNVDSLVVGQTLVLLPDDKEHLVSAGESLYSIAKDYGTTVQSILGANSSITNPAVISVGEVIKIPSTKKIGTIEVNGYTYPNINMDVLRKTLPYLTYLSIFNYEVKANGDLVNIPDEQLIQEARKAKVAPLMVITNIDQGRGFSSDILHSIFSSKEVQQKLTDNIIQTLKSKNYQGLNIDFEYVYPQDRENYNNFLTTLTKTLNNMGYIVNTALAPKTSANQPGILYESHDYKFHGNTVNHVIIMTYEWGYTYGPPMAVAPVNEVSRVLSYAVTEIASKKVFMSIPNYGYDWTLPYVKGVAAQTVSNVEAVDLASKTGSIIQYDKTSGSPFFNYYDSLGRGHVVWFEDARSINEKLMLINKYNLGGVSYWTIGKYFPQNWLVLNSLYDVKKVI